MIAILSEEFERKQINKNLTRFWFYGQKLISSE